MPPRKEPCRNFARGSCQFGDRCKFLHAAPQQSKPNNFGFGIQNQNQQQKPNPYGFGMQNHEQKPNPFDIGSKQNQSKPFDNKWVRPGSTNNNNNSTTSRQSDNQTQAAHKCTDPESCKREILEDLKNEKPMWKLTCYGHYKYGPCDIIGDVSYEELRAAAYDDAKRGLNMQSIVERERNLVQAKVGEFESLARNTYTIKSNLGPTSQNPFNVTPQSNNPPLVSSFTQLGPSVNTNFGPFGISSVTPPSNNIFGQQNTFPNIATGPPSNNLFQNQGEKSGFGQKNTIFGNPGTLTNQMTPETPQNPFNAIKTNQNAFSTFSNPNTVDKQLTNNSNGFFGNNTVNIEKKNEVQRGISDGDDSIWMKKSWSRGEVPEEAPPDKYIY